MLVHEQQQIRSLHCCKLHGASCPNEFSKHPTAQTGRTLDRAVGYDDLVESSNSSCQIEAIFSLICLIRRGHNEFDKFYTRLYRDFWYLKNKSSERALMSILDTVIDGPGSASNVALVAMTVLREWQISCSAYARLDEYKHKWLWPTTMVICPNPPDTVLNHYRRVAKGLRQEPFVWLLFYEIFQRIKPTGNLPLAPLTRLLQHSSKMHLLNLSEDLLRPTTISEKYKKLYSKLHNNAPEYGARVTLDKPVLRLLEKWDTKRILDFGCGKGNTDYPGIVSYDPALHADAPDGPFDALVSMDVLEHIPISDLPLVCKWMRLWSNRLILRISTRLAGRKLPNGENAHCTVRPAKWWLDFLDAQLPHNIAVVDKGADYVTASCVNK